MGSTPTMQRKNTSTDNSSMSKTKSSPESNNNCTQTNKSSPESNMTHNTRTKKSSPESKGLSSSTPTTQSDLRPQRSSYYSSPTKRKPSRGPEPEDESTAPLDTKRRSFDSTAVLISRELARTIFRPQPQSQPPMPPPTPLMGDVGTSPASLHYLMGGGVTSSPRNTGSSSHHMREIPEGIPRNVLVYPTTDWLQRPEQEQQPQQQQEQQQNPQQQPEQEEQQHSPTGPRRPSLGFDVDIQPDLRTEYRHIV
jgi:hypothetical protein